MTLRYFKKEASGVDIAVQVREVMVRIGSHITYHQQKQSRIMIYHDIDRKMRALDSQENGSKQVWSG